VFEIYRQTVKTVTFLP